MIHNIEVCEAKAVHLGEFSIESFEHYGGNNGIVVA
jgi:hypothetical protein